jgi:hypothetical protein
MAKPVNPTLDFNNPIVSGMVLCMPFNEGTGIPGDKTRNINIATKTGTPVWQLTGQDPEVLFAAASSQSYDLGNPSQLRITQDLSFCLEYKITTRPPLNKEYMFFTKDNALGANNTRGWSCDVAEWGNRGVRFYVAGGSSGELDSNVNCAAGDSAKVIGIYSVTNNHMKLIINGTTVGSQGATTTIVDDTANAAIAKRNGSGNEEYLDGVIRYLYVWNRELTATEITKLTADPYYFFINQHKKINSGLRPRPFSPGLAR